MSRVSVYRVTVEFGDCDPAQIVYFPNFFRWIDAASRYFFTDCGVPQWRETAQTLGVIGTPLVDVHARFIKTASYGDRLALHTSVSEWRRSSFVMQHHVMLGTDLLMEATETRVFAARAEGDAPGIRAVPIPGEIRMLCE